MNRFEVSWTDELPELIRQHGSVIVTSMREGIAIVIGYSGQFGLEARSYSFPHAGGITYFGGSLCISGSNGYYAFKPIEYSGCTLHLLKSKIYFGRIQPHELHSNNSRIWVGNTGFNCIAEVNDESSFTPFWYPPFISQSDSIGDRCHLNGFALSPEAKIPEYATLFCRTNSIAGWREANASDGCVYRMSTNEVICDRLLRPHSPVVYNDKLYFLESGSGKLIELDRVTNAVRDVHKAFGFVRGLKINNGVAMIGISVFRASFIDLPNKSSEVQPGLIFVDIKSGQQIGRIVFNSVVSEIFSVNLLNNDHGKSTRHLLDEGNGNYISIGSDMPHVFQ